MDFSLQDMTEFLPYLMAGAWVTIKLTVVSMFFALILGLILGMSRAAERAWLRIPAAVFIDIMRGTPLILQIFYIYYALPLVGIELEAFLSGTIALSLNYAAYLGEVFRSGIQAVPKGQWEASRSLGLPMGLTMRKIVLPQALRIVIPPAGNYFISLFKDSALVSVISLSELMRSGQLLAATTYKHFEIFTMVAIIYLAISYPASWLVTWLEHNFRIGRAR
jgi:polar amino acid transport system permease protein